MKDSEEKLDLPEHDYGDESIVHLEDLEHIRLRPGMYIGRLGDGTAPNDEQFAVGMADLDKIEEEL